MVLGALNSAASRYFLILCIFEVFFLIQSIAYSTWNIFSFKNLLLTSSAGYSLDATMIDLSLIHISNLGLTTDIFGPDAPETKGTFAVYIVGSVIGTVFISILASVVASWNIFDPIALGMASGVGSGSLMTAAAGTLGEIYPQQAENIMIMGGASDMLTGITGIYMGTFVGLPLAKKLYAILEPKIGRKNNQEVK